MFHKQQPTLLRQEQELAMVQHLLIPLQLTQEQVSQLLI
jgi:hypothetical protein